MIISWKRFSMVAGMLVCAAPMTACSDSAASGPEPGATDEYTAVAPGKADNYYSDVAAEFEVSGTIEVRFENPEDANDPVIRADKIGRRTTAIALYLTTFLTKKIENFFTNLSYGGFSAMARNHTMQPGDVQEVSPGVLRVKFSIDVGGPKDLMQALPKLPDAPAGLVQFDLPMPKGAEADPDNVPRGSIRNFDPATYTGELEHVRCDIEREETPADAYPQTASMMQDGVFDLTLFFGHDYNNPRSDITEAREAFEELSRWMGFQAPVASFDQLTRDSGPLTRTILSNGQQVKVEVRIFHSDMFVDSRKLGHDTALSELTRADVFFYNGHAGPWYGFYLSDDKPNDVKYTELATINLPEKQQIFVAQGCQTYSQYADVMYANPAKSEENLDVITTVNFSYGIGTMGIVRSLLSTSSDGRHRMVTFGTIIRELNREYWNSAKEVFYGVMGIDGNPQVHPYGAVENLGKPCTAAADCGDPDANVCVKPVGASQKVCGMVALDKAACPQGSALTALAQGSTIKNYACLP
jgi:hypothetical protein